MRWQSGILVNEDGQRKTRNSADKGNIEITSRKFSKQCKTRLRRKRYKKNRKRCAPRIRGHWEEEEKAVEAEVIALWKWSESRLPASQTETFCRLLQCEGRSQGTMRRPTRCRRRRTCSSPLLLGGYKLHCFLSLLLLFFCCSFLLLLLLLLLIFLLLFLFLLLFVFSAFSYSLAFPLAVFSCYRCYYWFFFLFLLNLPIATFFLFAVIASSLFSLTLPPSFSP